MDEYEELIDFLTRKGNLINHGFKTANKMINDLSEEQILKNKTIFKEFIAYINRQDQLKKIILFLEELIRLKNNFKSNDGLSLHNNWEIFLAEKVDEVIKGQEIFNMDHPLFGYNAFFRKLIKAYTDAENYEKCNELIHNYQNIADWYEVRRNE